MANYSLRDNPLTGDPNDKLAQLEGVNSFTREQIIDRALQRGNTLTRTDFLAAINAYAEEIAYITAEGNTINTPLFNTSLSITGVFTGSEDTFDSRRHTLKVNITAGTVLKEAVGKVKLSKVTGTSNLPMITGLRDTLSSSDETSVIVKAGSVIELTGARLKFDASDMELGVFFIANGAETRLSQVVENKPSKVLAVLPVTVEPGEYTVEVRTTTASNTSRATKAIKRGVFERPVTVTA